LYKKAEFIFKFPCEEKVACQVGVRKLQEKE